MPLLHLGRKKRRRLERLAARHSSQQRLVRRARIVLLAADGWQLPQIAEAVGCSRPTVRRWLARFIRGGIPGLFDAPRSGRPEVHGPSARLLVISVATSVPPEGETSWSHTMIRDELGRRGYQISAATVGTVLAEAKVRPHKVRGWLNRADDEQFWQKAGAVCRLYLNPPPGAVLLSVDEKTGIGARSRKRPAVRRPDGSVRREFEYVRHGTISILAAMEVTTGQMLVERIDRNDSVTFIAFLTLLDEVIDPSLPIHLIMDNGSSHTSKATRAWIAAHPRFSVTYTPTHASWLNIVEQFFSILTRKVLRHGDFASKTDLEDKITAFVIRYNDTAKPIQWRYDADADHARYLKRHAPDTLAEAA